MERYFKAIDKIKELESELQRRADIEVSLREQLEEAKPFETASETDQDLVEFVKKIANTKSKFAKEAKELLNK